MRWLLDRGVRNFVDLTEPGELTGWGSLLPPYAGLLADEAEKARLVAAHRRFGIPDLWVPAPEGMADILDHLDACVARRESAYVHCLGGRGRTGTVVACWLLSRAAADGHALSATDALDRLRALRERHGVPDPWDSPQTSVQFEFVRGWAERQLTPSGTAPASYDL